MQFTKEQSAAIESAGKTIVSASAGSGKTFVMINKLVAAIAGGADLDSVIAVTSVSYT
ncbi:MAG: UvrD-helicase domain-containing protein, partial [Clostridia bacterium]|nr:UvrD-helicase domain-containing protein [Clostridia bacterium]